MAKIMNAVLSLSHDHTKKTVRAVAKCTVKFSELELCEMKTCNIANMFKLKCKLRGKDSGLTGSDDQLFTYPSATFFPDADPTSAEHRTFDVLLGEGVLDEDWGQDEVYARFQLVNLYTLVSISKDSNVVSHSF